MTQALALHQWAQAWQVTDLMPYGLNLLVLYSGLKGSFLATQVFTFHQEPTIKFI